MRCNRLGHRRRAGFWRRVRPGRGHYHHARRGLMDLLGRLLYDRFGSDWRWLGLGCDGRRLRLLNDFCLDWNRFIGRNRRGPVARRLNLRRDLGSNLGNRLGYVSRDFGNVWRSFCRWESAPPPSHLPLLAQSALSPEVLLMVLAAPMARLRLPESARRLQVTTAPPTEAELARQPEAAVVERPPTARC